MPFTLEGRSYIETRSPQGVVIANEFNSFRDNSARHSSSLSTHLLESGGENEFYPHLRQWVRPILAEKDLEMSNLVCDPKDLPSVIRLLPSDTKVALVVNTFPTMGNRWLYTTAGLSHAGKLDRFGLDAYSHPNNHFICVPTAFRRLGLIDDRYLNAWREKIETINPVLSARRSTWTGHMISLRIGKYGNFFIGDQYGTGFIEDDVLVEMAQARKSFQLSEYFSQILTPIQKNSGIE